MSPGGCAAKPAAITAQYSSLVVEDMSFTPGILTQNKSHGKGFLPALV
jgi:hypothetical protein